MNVNGFFICFLNHFLYVLLKISLKNFPKFTLNKLKVLKSNVNFLLNNLIFVLICFYFL